MSLANKYPQWLRGACSCSAVGAIFPGDVGHSATNAGHKRQIWPFVASCWESFCSLCLMSPCVLAAKAGPLGGPQHGVWVHHGRVCARSTGNSAVRCSIGLHVMCGCSIGCCGYSRSRAAPAAAVSARARRLAPVAAVLVARALPVANGGHPRCLLALCTSANAMNAAARGRCAAQCLPGVVWWLLQTGSVLLGPTYSIQ